MKIKVFNSQSLNEIKEVDLALATNIDGECTVGRSANSGLVLDSPDVSRLHGKFYLRNGNYYFSDLGSRNGSIVNGKLAETNDNHMLKAGDVVRIGEFVLITEEIIPVFEEVSATVFGGIDATVFSGWRLNQNWDTPEVANQHPAQVSEIPEVMAEAPEAISVPEAIRQSPEAVEVPEQVTPEVSELVTPAAEEVSEASEVISIQDLIIIQPSEEPEVFEVSEVTSIQDLTIIQAPPEPEVTDATDVPAIEPVSEVPDLATPAPEAVSEAPEATSQAPEAVSEASGKEETSEVVSQVPEEISQVSEVTSIQDLTIIQIPESAPVLDVITQAPEEPLAAVTDATNIQTPASEVPELVTQTPEETTVTDATDVEAPEQPEVFIIQNEIIIQVPESAEVSEVIAQTPEAVSEISEITYVQTPVVFEAALAEVISQPGEEVVVVVSKLTDATDVPEIEAVNEVSEPAIPEPEAVIEPPEAIAQASEAVSEAFGEVEAPEVVSQVPEEISQVSEANNIQAPESEVPELVTQTPEETVITDATDVHAPEVSEEAAVSEVITHAPTVSEAPEVTSQAPEEAEVSDLMAQTPEPESQVPEIISEKYIALMAHDSKKSDLAQFVAQHKEFLSKCLTIATPSISETLYQQTGVAISQKTPSVPVGGYQTIASLVGSGDILAVILLRDFLVAQSGQANEEALLRLCNINQVLFATNVPTAEAVVHYIKNKVTS